jgi:glycine/D-amino acid oxidase-like deaminating enzyme
MNSITHPHALHFDRAVDSYWEASADPLGVGCPALTTDERCDVAVIGGGFTGLSAALELAEQGVDVRLLEAGHIGWGASGRNGGFACIGSHKLAYTKMIATYGLDATKAYYRAMSDSVALVSDNARRYGIDVWAREGGEVTLAHLPSRIAELKEEQSFLKETFGERTEFLALSDLKERGLYGPEFHAGLWEANATGIHPLNYARGLARAAAKSGAKLHEHSRLVRWEQQGSEHRLTTPSATLTARRVLFATNGYTPEEIATPLRGKLLPVLSSILVTRPLTADERQRQGWTSELMAFDSRKLLHYFRMLPNGRFLFGGRGGTDGSEGAGIAYRQTLLSHFHRMFPAWRDVAITHYWRGYACLSYDLVPYVGALDDGGSVWTAIAWHGNGVAMASWSGRAVANLITKKKTRGELPGVLTRRLATFPIPALRPLYLKGAYVWYGRQDAK